MVTGQPFLVPHGAHGGVLLCTKANPPEPPPCVHMGGRPPGLNDERPPMSNGYKKSLGGFLDSVLLRRTRVLRESPSRALCSSTCDRAADVTALAVVKTVELAGPWQVPGPAPRDPAHHRAVRFIETYVRREALACIKRVDVHQKG